MKKGSVFYKVRLDDLVKASIAPLHKQVQDNEALFNHMVANSNWLVLDVDAAKIHRIGVSGSYESLEVRSLVNYLRSINKKTFTRRIGGNQWYVEVRD
jgi:hypothetical protein